MTTLFHMATHGVRYSIALQQASDGTFQIREYKHGRERDCYPIGNLNYDIALNEYNLRIENASKFSGIDYVLDINNKSDCGVKR